jgi:hypothetical protein
MYLMMMQSNSRIQPSMNKSYTFIVTLVPSPNINQLYRRCVSYIQTTLVRWPQSARWVAFAKLKLATASGTKGDQARDAQRTLTRRGTANQNEIWSTNTIARMIVL